MYLFILKCLYSSYLFISVLVILVHQVKLYNICISNYNIPIYNIYVVNLLFICYMALVLGNYNNPGMHYPKSIMKNIKAHSGFQLEILMKTFEAFFV